MAKAKAVEQTTGLSATISDFMLLAAAFAKDQAMALQVCKLMADADITETTCKQLLRFVGEEKLKNTPKIVTTVQWLHSLIQSPYWRNTNITFGQAVGVLASTTGMSSSAS